MKKPTTDNTKQQQQDTAIPIQRCGHSGKWGGVGQTTLNLGAGNIILMVTVVCGECGDTVVTMNPVPLTPKKTTGLVVPETKLIT